MAGRKTVDLVIIAKTSWDGGYCYLGYDPVKSNLVRPVLLSVERKPQPWPKEPMMEEFKLFHTYKFRLSAELGSENTLPHCFDDVLVDRASEVKHECPWTQDELYSSLEPLAVDYIDDVFPCLMRQDNNDKLYAYEGTEFHGSVGILRCRKSELEFYWEPERNKPIIRYHPEDCQFNFTPTNCGPIGNFINSGGPDQSLLLVFSLGRPINPSGIWPFDRCYVLAVALIREMAGEEDFY